MAVVGLRAASRGGALTEGCATGAGEAETARRRPRLSPAIADTRRAVRETLGEFFQPEDSGVHFPSCVRPAASSESPASPLVLVALSGGADSLALAAATAFEAPRHGIAAGAVIVDHGLQAGSAEVAARAAGQAEGLGLEPVLVRRVRVDGSSEEAARQARYAAFDAASADTGARAILLAHTLDDQAESVLLGLARGSGARSLGGMRPVTGHYLRPLLSVPRSVTHQFCRDAALEPWHDPMNEDERYLRVRVRRGILPVMEDRIGPGVAGALARTADELREDADALDSIVQEMLEDLCQPAEGGLAIPVASLAANPPALRNRVIRQAVHAEFGVWLHRAHVLSVGALVTHWHGQQALDLPGVRVVRQGAHLVFTAAGQDED